MLHTLDEQQSKNVEQLCAAAGPQEMEAFLWLQIHPKQFTLLIGRGPDFDPERMTLFHDLKKADLNELALLAFFQFIPAFPLSEEDWSQVTQAPDQDMTGLLECWNNLLLEMLHQLPNGYGVFQSLVARSQLVSNLSVLPLSTTEELLTLHNELTDSQMYELAALVLSYLRLQVTVS